MSLVVQGNNMSMTKRSWIYVGVIIVAVVLTFAAQRFFVDQRAVTDSSDFDPDHIPHPSDLYIYGGTQLGDYVGSYYPEGFDATQGGEYLVFEYNEAVDIAYPWAAYECVTSADDVIEDIHECLPTQLDQMASLVGDGSMLHMWPVNEDLRQMEKYFVLIMKGETPRLRSVIDGEVFLEGYLQR